MAKQTKSSFLSLTFFYWAPVCVWAGVIFYLSNLPADDLPSWEIPYLDKGVHAVEFGILAFLFLRGAVATFLGQTMRFQCLLTVMAVFFYALLDEYHQSFVLGRVTDVYDLVADSIGIFFALFLAKNRLTRALN